MKVNLFNDKQVKTIVESVNRIFVNKFTVAEKELEALLDAEIKIQLESTDVSEVRTEREEKKVELSTLSDLQNQIRKLDHTACIYVKKSCYKQALTDFDAIKFDTDTEERVNNKAKQLAERVLGIDDISYRQKCLRADIAARTATMAVTDYDSVVSQLEKQITIKDYFVTL